MKSILAGLLLVLMVLSFQNCGESEKTQAQERAVVIIDPPDCFDLGNCTAQEVFLNMEYEELAPYEQTNGSTPTTGHYGYDSITGRADLTKFIPRHEQFIEFLEANNQTLNNTEKQQIRSDQVLIQFKHLMAHPFDFMIPYFFYATEYFFSIKIKFPAPSSRVIAFDNYSLNNLQLNNINSNTQVLDFGYGVIQGVDSRIIFLRAEAGGNGLGSGSNKNFFPRQWSVGSGSNGSTFFSVIKITNTTVVNGTPALRQILASKVQKRTTEIPNIYELSSN